MEPVVASLSGKAAAAVARPLAAHLRDRIFGTKYERDLHAACQAAAETVIAAELVTADDVAVRHAVDLLVRLTDAHFPETSLLLGIQADLETWQTTAEELGMDLSTFPAEFSHIVAGMRQQLPIQIAKRARSQDSGVFAPFVVESLDWLRTNLQTLVDTWGLRLTAPPALHTDFERFLLEVASRYGDGGRQTTSTPMVLLALLTYPSGKASTAFDSIDDELGQRLSRMLESHLGSVAAQSDPQTPIYNRADIRRAQALAASMGAPFVPDVFVLAAFLDTDSGTRDDLAELLGDSKYTALQIYVYELVQEFLGSRRTPRGVLRQNE